MSCAIGKNIESFKRDERGAVAITFGLMATVLFLVAGLAIDYGRAIQASTRLEAALDAAALAGAKAIRLQGLSTGEAEALTERVFNTNMENTGADAADITALNVTVDPVESEVSVTATARVPAYFGPLAGVDQFTFDTSATAIFEAVDIEIAMQLDVTGSMRRDGKLADLQSAAELLIDTVLTNAPTGQRVRVAIAPYAAGINAGSYAAAITDGTSTASGSDCVFERKDLGLQDSDVAPSGSASLRSSVDLPRRASFVTCPSAEIRPLTDNEGALRATIRSFSAAGVTAGHLGTAWAWYLLSPNWDSVWTGDAQPAAYGKSVRKFAIVMTDGEYNTFTGRGTGSTFKRLSSTAAKDTCAAMRADGITVYTIGFKLTEPDAIDTLNACASGPSAAFLAEDGDELKAAFNAIAQQIITLRLTS